MTKSQLLEDMGISAIPDESDSEALLAEGLLRAPTSLSETLGITDTFDIYSYSTQDLKNKYHEMLRMYDETGNEEYKNTAELIQDELFKNHGIELN